MLNLFIYYYVIYQISKTDNSLLWLLTNKIVGIMDITVHLSLLEAVGTLKFRLKTFQWNTQDFSISIYICMLMNSAAILNGINIQPEMELVWYFPYVQSFWWFFLHESIFHLLSSMVFQNIEDMRKNFQFFQNSWTRSKFTKKS